MNSRERVKLALSHQQPDRPPLWLWMVPEISEKLKKHFGVATEDELHEEICSDVWWINPDYIGPKMKTYEDGSWQDPLGMRLRIIKNKFGSYEDYVNFPLANVQSPADLDHVEDFQWVQPDWYDYSNIKEKIERASRKEPRWIVAGTATVFERSWQVMGFEKMFIDMAINPELVKAVMDRYQQFFLENTCRTLEAADGRIDMVYFGCDLASQDGLLISQDMFREFIKEGFRDYIDTIKAQFGSHLKFFMHSCGAVSELIPELIEVGVDVLNPIQVKAARMEPQGLKDKFGDKLSFCGGLDIQDLLPNGSPDEVKAEAKRLISILGNDGGYIASAAHAVQADTSVENILAMLEGFKE